MMNEIEKRLADLLGSKASTVDDRIVMRPDAKSKIRRRRTRRYAGVALVSVLIVAGIALPLKALAPLADRDKGTRPAGAPDATATTGSAPQVAVISCSGDTPVVDTPTIQAQSDGVHLSTPGDGPMPVRLFPEQATPGIPGQGWAEDGPSTYILDVPPGDYLAICDPDSSASTHEVTSGQVPSAPLTISDPQGFFAPFTETSCPGTKPYLGTAWTPYPDLNPMTSADQVLRRAFTGIEQTDVIVHAGYNPDPAYGGWQQSFWQVLRGGTSVATIGLHVAGHDATNSVLQATDVCADSGIGSPADIPTRPVEHLLGAAGNPDAPLATPFEVPGYGHCSPYDGADCVPVWMSWARLASLSDQEVVQSDFPKNNGDLPWCPSDGPRGCTVNPNDQPKVVFMPASDALRWFQTEACARSYDAMCREEPTGGSPDVPISSETTPEPTSSGQTTIMLEPGETRTFPPGELRPGDTLECPGRGSVGVPKPGLGVASSSGLSAETHPDGSVVAHCDAGPAGNA